MNTKLIVPLKFIFLILLLYVLYFYLSWSYESNYIQERVRRFFQNAAIIVYFEPIPGLGLAVEPLLESIKQHPGNRLDLVKESFLDVKEKHLIDPFKSHKELPIYYGRVQYPGLKLGDDEKHQEPVWFTYSVGPSGKNIELKMSELENKNEIYQFMTPPYASTNGLKSTGYLYLDSRGFGFGEIE